MSASLVDPPVTAQVYVWNRPVGDATVVGSGDWLAPAPRRATGDP